MFVCCGLFQDNDVISAMRAGKLSFCKPNKYWVESSHKRVSSVVLLIFLFFSGSFLWIITLCHLLRYKAQLVNHEWKTNK